MSYSRSDVLLFRAALVTAMSVIMYLATTKLNIPVVDKLNDKVTHIMAFYALAMLEDFSFPRVEFGLTKVLTLMAYGVFIEFVQYFIPYRTASVYDLMADAVGILVYVASTPALKQIPYLRRRWSVSPLSG